MKDYVKNGDIYNITLDNGKVVKVATQWVEKTMKALDTDLEDVLLMFLEDNNYLINEEQQELDTKAKNNKIKVVKAESEKPRKKTTRERKPNPTKEKIISTIAKNLELIATDIKIENVGKIITFKVDNKEFKLDLTEKRIKKDKKD